METTGKAGGGILTGGGVVRNGYCLAQDSKGAKAGLGFYFVCLVFRGHLCAHVTEAPRGSANWPTPAAWRAAPYSIAPIGLLDNFSAR